MYVITVLQPKQTGGKHFICNFCHRRFTHDAHLKSHLRMHTGIKRERPYVCSVCSQRFCDESVLTRHHSIHTGEIEYVYSECSTGFSKSFNPKQNLTVHNGETKFICNVSNKRFAQKSLLKPHLRTHKTMIHSCSEENQSEKYLQDSFEGKHSSIQKESGPIKHLTHSGETLFVSDVCNNSETLSLSCSEENQSESNVRDKKCFQYSYQGKHSYILNESSLVKSLLSEGKPSVSDVYNQSKTRFQSCSKENLSDSDQKDKKYLQDSSEGQHSSIQKESDPIKHLTHSAETPSVSDLCNNSKTLSLSCSEENQSESDVRDKKCFQYSYQGKHSSVQNESSLIKNILSEGKTSVFDVNNERKTQSQSCYEENQSESKVKEKICLQDSYQGKHSSVQKESGLKKHIIYAEKKSFAPDECNNSETQSQSYSGSNQSESDVKNKRCRQDSYQGKHSYIQKESGLIQHLLIHSGEKTSVSDVYNKSQSHSHCEENQSKSDGKDKSCLQNSYQENQSSIQKEKFMCSECNKKFSNNSSLVQHLSIHSRERPFVCNICNKRFAKKPQLQVHHRTHTGVKPFLCNVCDKSFATKVGLKYHLILHTGVRPFICNFCHRSFTLKTHLKLHLRMHTGERPYVCSVCNHRFCDNSILKRHLLIHTGEKKFSCGECKKRFSSNWNLKLHLTVHTGERKFDCNICNKSFTQKSHLKKHIRTHKTKSCIHTEKKPFICNVCYKNICCDSHLKEHLQSHTENKLFVCSQCNKSFREKDDLRVHVRIHAREELFVCNFCNKKFNQNFSLKAHLRIHADEKVKYVIKPFM